MSAIELLFSDSVKNEKDILMKKLLWPVLFVCSVIGMPMRSFCVELCP